jgi:hypothetical protein
VDVEVFPSIGTAKIDGIEYIRKCLFDTLVTETEKKLLTISEQVDRLEKQMASTRYVN